MSYDQWKCHNPDDDRIEAEEKAEEGWLEAQFVEWLASVNNELEQRAMSKEG